MTAAQQPHDRDGTPRHRPTTDALVLNRRSRPTPSAAPPQPRHHTTARPATGLWPLAYLVPTLLVLRLGFTEVLVRVTITGTCAYCAQSG